MPRAGSVWPPRCSLDGPAFLSLVRKKGCNSPSSSRAPTNMSNGNIWTEFGWNMFVIKPSMWKLGVSLGTKLSTALDSAELRGISCFKNLVTYLLEHLKGKLEFINPCLENKCENAQSYFLRREEVRSVKKRESAEPQSERQVPLKRPERFLLLLWIIGRRTDVTEKRFIFLPDWHETKERQNKRRWEICAWWCISGK